MKKVELKTCAFLFSAVLFAMSGFTPSVAGATEQQTHAPSAKHKVIFQVSDDDPKKWALTFNNVENIQKDFGKENVDIEVVAYGPGIGMLKLDSSVATRIRNAVESHVKVVACQNTMHAQHLEKQDMLSDVSYVPSGVIELIKKQEDGYAYLKP
jgi:intracellular sulfur oxidation DsrE/DsrF family protein